jgi:hypothetical protein
MGKHKKLRTVQRGKGVKPAMVLTTIRLPKQVVEYFKEFTNFSVEIRKVLTAHVERDDSHIVKQTAINQQRWQDILAEENEDEALE